MSIDLATARLLARLCDQAGVSGSPPTHLAEPAGLLSALRRNKMPLLSLRTEGLSPSLQQFVQGDAFQSALMEDRTRWQGWRDEYSQVHDALRQAGIADVLIKYVGMAPSLPYA